MANRVRKTEHSGAKNGGGHWGNRQEAKKSSKKLRRQHDKKEKLEDNAVTKRGHKGRKVADMEFSFEPLNPNDIPLLKKWLKEPHVAEFWQESEDEEELRQKFLGKLQKRGVRPYIVYLDNRPIGYIQDYEACLVGGGWWPNAKPGTFGVDQFIGDPSLVNQGFGTKIIRAFIHRLFGNQSVEKVITDPDPKNVRAIRAYEKVGFKKVNQIKTPGGDALLMQLDRSDLKL